MAAYKKLKKEDSYLTTYVAHKSFTVSGSQHDEVGVETYIGISGSGAWLPSGSDSRLVGTDYEHDTRLVYNSIYHLYYSGYDNTGLPTSSSNSMSGSAYENYLQSSYTAYQRRAQEDFTVISIPQNLFGTYIRPGSVRLSPPAINSGSNYVDIYENTQNVYDKQPEDFKIILLATGSAATTDTVSIRYLSSSGYTGGNNGSIYYDNNNSSDGNTNISNIAGINTNDYDLYVFDNRDSALDGSEIQLALNLFDAGKSVLITGTNTAPANYTGSNGTEWPIMAGAASISTSKWMTGPSAIGFGLPSGHPIASGLSGNVGISPRPTPPQNSDIKGKTISNWDPSLAGTSVPSAGILRDATGGNSGYAWYGSYLGLTEMPDALTLTVVVADINHTQRDYHFDFYGTTGGVTRLDINAADGGIFIDLWGAGIKHYDGPFKIFDTDDYTGAVSMTISATWDFANNTLSFTLNGDGEGYTGSGSSTFSDTQSVTADLSPITNITSMRVKGGTVAAGEYIDLDSVTLTVGTTGPTSYDDPAIIDTWSFTSDTGKTITSLKKNPGNGALVHPFTVNTNTTFVNETIIDGSLRYNVVGTDASITSWIATNSNGGRMVHLQMYALSPLPSYYTSITTQAATNLREFLLRTNTAIQEYYSFASSSYIDEIDTLYGGTQLLQDGDYVENEGNYINESISEFIVPGFDDYSTVIIDDKNGNLILSASQPQRIVGNVIYSHGMIVITNPQVGSYYSHYFSGSLSWQSSHPIYTYNYHCPIKENEFNFSLNPSAIKNGTSGSIADNITGSYFKPYFTTVGLYNDTHELVAVAKLAQPIPVSDNNETTVVVKLDM